MAPLALDALHIRVLILGQQLGLKLVDPRLSRNALGRALGVARKHNDMFDAQRMQIGDGLAHSGLERILDAEHAHDRAVDRQVQRRQALHLGLDALLDVGFELRASSSNTKCAEPMMARRPSMDEAIPCATMYSTAAWRSRCSSPRSRAALTTARATGCGKCSSRQAEKRRTSSSLQPSVVSTQARRGCASVSVPVLSNTMVSALANDSKYLAPLTITPILAASLMAVMTATEPVSLSAHE